MKQPRKVTVEITYTPPEEGHLNDLVPDWVLRNEIGEIWHGGLDAGFGIAGKYDFKIVNIDPSVGDK